MRSVRVRIRMVWLGLVCILVCGKWVAGAVLENPDFESGDLSGWHTHEQSLSLSVSTNETFNRNYAARLSGTHSGAEWVTNSISQTIPIIPGDLIQALGFTYWKSSTNTSSSAQGYLEARLDGPDGIEASQVWSEPHDGWVFFEFNDQARGVANGGFEMGTIMPWEGASEADHLDMALSREIRHRGDYALRMHGSWSTGWSFNQVLQVIALSSGDVVRARAWVKAETLSATGSGAWSVAGIKLEKEGTSHQWEAVVSPPQQGGEWVELRFFAPISEAGFYAFRCMVAGDSDNGLNTADVYFDDVQVRIHHAELLNGGFESGDLDHWVDAVDEGTVEVADTQVDEGDYSLRIHGDWSGWSFDRAVQEVYLRSGDEVTLSGRILMETLDIDSGWLISGMQLAKAGGPQYEHKFEHYNAPSGWQNLSIVQTITNTGIYEVRCMVMGDGPNAEANVYFDDMRMTKAGGPQGDPEQVTLTLRYVGTAGGVGEESTVDIYFDTATIGGSSANPDHMDDIHGVLLDASASIAESEDSITPVLYPPLFTYGYPGGDTNEVMYPSHVEAGVGAWRFRRMTNDVALVMTNTIVLYELGASGPGHIEFDQYMYCGRRWGTGRGAALDIVTNAPYWTLGTKNGTSEGFGDGPFDAEHTYVIGTSLSNFPRRMVTQYDGHWPTRLNIVFEENLGLYDRDYDKYFVLSTVTTNGADAGAKALKFNLATTEAGHTNLFFESFEIHMGWASEEDAHGMVDYPNVTYQGHNEVFLRKGYEYGIVDRENWYAQPVARGSATIEPITLYSRKNGHWNFIPYEEYLYAWPNAGSGVRSIFDEDQTDRLPGPASYPVGFKIGHQYGTNEFGEAEFPSLIEIRGNGYFRMTDYDGVMGGSLRPIAADIFGLHQYVEDSPLIPEAYVALASRTTATNELTDGFMRMFLPIRSKANEWFTGVIKVDAHFAPERVVEEGAYIEMETDVYAKRAVVLDEHGPLNLFAQVNMYWRGSQNVNQEFEGHDHDTIIIKKGDGEWITYNTLNPPTNIYRRSLASLSSNDVVYIMQQDRGPESYGFATEAPYRRVSHFEFTILDDGDRDLTLDVFEQNTISEINDNIVVACAVNESLAKGERVHSRIRYRSFYAPGVMMIQPNTPDGGEGWGDDTYTIEFYATDGEDKPLKANLYYGNGADTNWTLINVSETLLVPTNTHRISYAWDVSSVPTGAYYIKAEAQRVEGGKVGFALSRSRLQVGPTYGFPNNGSTNVTVVTNEFGYLGANMSFETGDLLDWAVAGDHLDIHATDARAYDGTYSARMQGDWTGWSWNNVQQEIPCLDSESLRVQGRIYIGNLAKAGTNWLACGIKMESTNNNDYTSSGQEFDAATHGTGSWLNVDFQRTAPVDGTDRLLLWVAGHDCSGAEVYFDDIRVSSTNTGAVVTNEMRSGYWEGDAPLDVTGYDVLGFHVAMESGGEELLVWATDAYGVTNSLAVTNYINPIIGTPQRVLVPWDDFPNVDLSELRSIGFSSAETSEPVVTAMRAGPNPVSASVTFIAPPMTNSFAGGMPHYNPGEVLTQEVTVVNQSGTSLNGVTIQLLQEYGETTWWWDTSPHVDPRWSERTRKGDRLGGNFEQVWEDVTIASGSSVVLTNVYIVPEGLYIDHTEMAIPSGEDWFAGRNYDGVAQIRVVVRNGAGDNVYENDQIASYSMDDDFDLDNDGLPDWWEFLHSGSHTGMNPEDDPDEDGYTNLEEFLADTDPFDADSYPGQSSGPTSELALTEAPGTTYAGGVSELRMVYDFEGPSRWLRHGIKAKGTLYAYENFEGGTLDGWTLNTHANIDWSIQSGVLEAEVVGTGGYAYIYRDDVITGGTNLTIEYDVQFVDGAELGGLVFGDRTLYVNPSLCGWDGQETFSSPVVTGLWHNVVVHLRDAEPYPVSDLYIDDAVVFVNQAVVWTNWNGPTAVGWLSSYYQGKVRWDNLRVMNELYSIASESVSGSNDILRAVAVPDHDPGVPGHQGTAGGSSYEWYAYLSGAPTQVTHDVTVRFAPRLMVEEDDFPRLVPIGGTSSVPVLWADVGTNDVRLRIWLEDAVYTHVVATTDVAVTESSSTGLWTQVTIPANAQPGTTYFWGATMYPESGDWWDDRLGYDDTYRFDHEDIGVEPEIDVVVDKRFIVFDDDEEPSGTYVATWNGGSATFDPVRTGENPPEGTLCYWFAGNSWLGWGVFQSSGTLDMSAYTNGYLRFSVKSTESLKVELEGPSGTKQAKYISSSGGVWAEYSLSLSDYDEIDLGQIKGLFMITSDVATTTSVDNVYWSLLP